MKKLSFISFAIIITGLLITSCDANFQRSHRATIAQTGAKSSIENVEISLAKNAESKVEQIAVFAAGTDHALRRVVNPPEEVDVAKQMNDRVISLSGSPSIDELNRVYAMVDDLLSELQMEQERGARELGKKDNEISAIQRESKRLLDVKDKEIRKYMTASDQLSSQLQTARAELSQMNKYFGLGAVVYGLQRFVVRMAWFIGGFAVIFFVLRVFARSHPMVGAIFSIFEIFSSFVLNLIKGLTPGSFKFAKFTPTAITDQYRRLSEKIVDIFETLKDRDKASELAGGQPKKYSLVEVLSLFSERFGDDDKHLVKEIKSKLGW